MNDVQPDDLQLQAYADGELGPDETGRIGRWLQHHPEDAARVIGWQAQSRELRKLQLALLDEPVPAHLSQIMQPAATASHPGARVTVLPLRWPHALAASILLLIGSGAGWFARPWLAPAPTSLAGPAVPAFVQDATAAYAVYAPEKRHPVEVGADQQGHLVQWLSRRLGAELRAPVLTSQGFQLIGGRLLPGRTPNGPAGRAQFMYENDRGERLTLYVSILPTGSSAPTSFRHVSQGSTNTFYWVDGAQGYALTGDLPRELLGTLADTVYRQLFP